MFKVSICMLACLVRSVVLFDVIGSAESVWRVRMCEL